MKVLITGGAGFIGRWLTKLFLDKNETVIIVDNLSNSSTTNIDEFKSNKNFTFHLADYGSESWQDSINWEEIDIVYHLASKIVVQDSIDNPYEFVSDDYIKTLGLLEKVRKATKPPRFIFMSTCMVYNAFGCKVAIDEEYKVIANSPYAAMKIGLENLVIAYGNTYGIDVAIARPFNTYGAFQKTTGEGGVIPIFLNKAIKGENLNIYGDGEQTRDFLYVEDCAEFLYLLGTISLENKEDEVVFNAGTGNQISINYLAQMISKKIKHISHIHPESEVNLKCDCRKAERILNWKPKVNLATGLQKTMDYIKERKEK